MLNKPTRITLEWIAGIFGLLLLAAGLLFVRLAAGPMEANWLAPLIAGQMTDETRGLSTSIREASLSWNEKKKQAEWILNGLVVHNRANEAVATVPYASARLRVLPLLMGKLRFRSLVMSGANINLERTDQGQLTLLGVEPKVKPSRTATAFPLAALLADWPRRVAAGMNILGRADLVEIRATHVSINDRAQKTIIEGDLPELLVALNDEGAVKGQGRLTFTNEPQPFIVGIDVNIMPKRSSGEVTITFSEFNPTTIGRLDQDYMALLNVDMSLTGYLNVTYTPEGTMQMTFGLQDADGVRGRIMVPNLPEPLAVDGFAAKISAVATGSAGVNFVKINHITVTRGDAKLVVSGSMALDEDSQQHLLNMKAELRNLPFSEIGTLWPVTAAIGGRTWVTQNMPEGTVSKATFELQGQVTGSDSIFTFTSIGGHIWIDNATIDYFHPLPPATGVNAVADYTDKGFYITIEQGKIRDIALQKGGTVKITELDKDIQNIAVDAPLIGPLAGILTILNSPPLEYPKKVGIEPASLAGRAEVTMKLGLPLLNAIKLEEIKLGVTGKIIDFASSKLVPAFAITQGNLAIDLTTDTMKISGVAHADGAEASVVWHEIFSPAEGRPSSVADIEVAITSEQLAKLGIDVPGTMKGAAPASITYRRFNDRADDIIIGADLTPADINFAKLDYVKPAGTRGGITASLSVADGAITLHSLNARGPGLDIKGKGHIAKGGTITSLVFNPVRVGANDLRLDYADGKAMPRIAIKGKSVNLGAVLNAEDGPEAPKQPDDKGGSYDIDVDVERADFGKDKFFTPFKLQAVRTSAGWQSLMLNSQAGDVPVVASLRPDGAGGGRVLHVDTPDLGTVLRRMDITEDIVGGKLSLDGQSGAPGSPIRAVIKLDDYRVNDLPFIVRLLNALSLDGLTPNKKNGLAFKRLRGDVIIDGDVWHFKNVRTAGGSLGLTSSGTINLDTNEMDIEGTVVPYSSANKVIGAIPIIGTLLTGGEGGGVFAAAFYAKGQLGDPKVSVNPLSVLAPGIIRNIFFLDN